MSVTGESVLAVGQENTTEFYNIFTIHWKSEGSNSLTFWVTAETSPNEEGIVVNKKSFDPAHATQTLYGSAPGGSAISFSGTITAAWHGPNSGKLSGQDMLFTMADLTTYNINSGDIGVW